MNYLIYLHRYNRTIEFHHNISFWSLLLNDTNRDVLVLLCRYSVIQHPGVTFDCPKAKGFSNLLNHTWFWKSYAFASRLNLVSLYFTASHLWTSIGGGGCGCGGRRRFCRRGGIYVFGGSVGHSDRLCPSCPSSSSDGKANRKRRRRRRRKRCNFVH